MLLFEYLLNSTDEDIPCSQFLSTSSILLQSSSPHTPNRPPKLLRPKSRINESESTQVAMMTEILNENKTMHALLATLVERTTMLESNVQEIQLNTKTLPPKLNTLSEQILRIAEKLQEEKNMKTTQILESKANRLREKINWEWTNTLKARKFAYYNKIKNEKKSAIFKSQLEANPPFIYKKFRIPPTNGETAHLQQLRQDKEIFNIKHEINVMETYAKVHTDKVSNADDKMKQTISTLKDTDKDIREYLQKLWTEDTKLQEDISNSIWDRKATFLDCAPNSGVCTADNNNATLVMSNNSQPSTSHDESHNLTNELQLIRNSTNTLDDNISNIERNDIPIINLETSNATQSTHINNKPSDEAHTSSSYNNVDNNDYISNNKQYNYRKNNTSNKNKNNFKRNTINPNNPIYNKNSYNNNRKYNSNPNRFQYKYNNFRYNNFRNNHFRQNHVQYRQDTFNRNHYGPNNSEDRPRNYGQVYRENNNEYPRNNIGYYNNFRNNKYRRNDTNRYEQYPRNYTRQTSYNYSNNHTQDFNTEYDEPHNNHHFRKHRRQTPWT